jgi:hypothetical protein
MVAHFCKRHAQRAAPALLFLRLTRPRALTTAFSIALCFFAGPFSYGQGVTGQDAKSCQLEPGKSVSVCFGTPPLEVDRCKQLVVPHFEVARKDDVPYYFTYHVYANFGDGDVEITDGQATFGQGSRPESEFLLTDNNPFSRKSLVIPFSRNGNYQIQVEIHAKGLDVAFAPSPIKQLQDSPVVRSIVVGVSDLKAKQETPVRNLRHADSDARVVRDLLVQLFPDSPPPILLTSDDPHFPATRDQLNIEFDNLLKTSGNECSSKDWFVFYFSGHGIIATDTNGTFQHYLGMQNLDPKELQSTGVWIESLLDRIKQLPAQNKLVILDSCFSGLSRQQSSKTLSATSAADKAIAGIHRSSKSQFVQQGRLVEPFQIGSPDPSATDPDANAGNEFAEFEGHAKRHALYLSATTADQTAEEGIVRRIPVTKEKPDFIFIPADQEESQPEDLKKVGHGLFTYLLVWKVESQLSGDFSFKEVLEGDKSLMRAAAPDQCTISFSDAEKLLEADLVLAKQTDSDIQQPEGVPTRPEGVPSMACRLTVSAGSSDAQNQH